MRRLSAPLIFALGLLLAPAAAFAQDPAPAPTAAAPQAPEAQAATKSALDALVAEANLPAPEAAPAATAPAIAPTAPAPQAQPVPDAGGTTPGSGSLWVLFIGSGLIAMAGWGVSLWKKKQLAGVDSSIRHIQTVAIGPKHQIALVEVHGQTLLLGLADGHISRLDTPAVGAHEATATPRTHAPRAAAAPRANAAGAPRTEHEDDHDDSPLQSANWYAAMQDALADTDEPQPAPAQRPTAEEPAKDTPRAAVSAQAAHIASRYAAEENASKAQPADEPAARGNRETDKVLVGLKALEARGRGAA